MNEKEFWLVTTLTGGNNGYVNNYIDHFPLKKDLEESSLKYGGDGLYAIIYMKQLTEEQYNKLTKDE